MSAIHDLKDEQKNWRALSVEERVGRVFVLKSIIKDRTDEIVSIMTGDGKPEFEALSQEVGLAVRLIDYYCSNAPDLLNKKIQKQGWDKLLFAGKSAEKRREPYGVFGMIPAWNGAFQFTFGDAVPALLAGNTVISKPSELVNPDLVELMQEIVEEAELSNIFRIVHGGPETGKALVQGVDGVHFTGSTEVGRKIQRACFERGMDEGREIPFIGEMGGFDPMIVFPDCDGERAVNAAVWGRCNNSGQNCNAVKVVYYVGSADKARNFACRVAEEMSRLEQSRDYGPLVSESQFKKLQGQLESALGSGVECLTHDNPLEAVESTDGLHFPPATLFMEEWSHDISICCDETFGPILPVVPVESEERALELVNGSPYGLGASIWTNDENLEERMVRALDVGNVCVRDVLVNYAVVDLPFVGRRHSGTGLRHSPAGLLCFTKPKSVLKASRTDKMIFGAKDREDYWFPYGRREGVFRFLVESDLGL